MRLNLYAATISTLACFGQAVELIYQTNNEFAQNSYEDEHAYALSQTYAHKDPAIAAIKMMGTAKPSKDASLGLKAALAKEKLQT